MFHYFKRMLRVFDLMKHANFSGHFAKSACIEELRRSVGVYRHKGRKLTNELAGLWMTTVFIVYAGWSIYI